MNAGSALRAFVLLGGVCLGSAASAQDLQTFANRAASGNRFELDPISSRSGSRKTTKSGRLLR